MQLLLQYQSSSMTWTLQPFCMSIQKEIWLYYNSENRIHNQDFWSVQNPITGFTQGWGQHSQHQGLGWHCWDGSTMRTRSGSLQRTCLTDWAGQSHCLAMQNMSVCHQPQHVLSLLISNIPGRVSAERITLFSHLTLSLPPPKRDV